LCELNDSTAVAIVIILVYVFSYNLFTLVKGTTAFIAGKPEEVLNPIKVFIKLFMKKVIANIKVTTVSDYCCISHIMNEGFYLFKSELAIPTQDLQYELHKVNISTLYQYIDFLKFYNKFKLEDLLTVLNKEKWVSVLVPHHYLSLINAFHGTDNTLPAEDSYKQLISDDIAYWCSESLLHLINPLCEYIQMIAEIRDIAYESFCSLIELIKVKLRNID